MDQNTILIIAVVAVIIVIALIYFAVSKRRTDQLRSKYGDEYDRTLEAADGKRDAEADLAEREKRVSELKIRALTPAEHDRYLDRWQVAKAEFVDSPRDALGKADDLVTDVMKTRGYPVTDFEHRHKDLTVEHGDVARRYLDGHEVRERALADDANTEEMRAAMKHYEAMFDRLIDDIATHDDRTVENA